MRAMTCPCVTLEPSSTVTSASRPAYFEDTSTWVASMRPFDLTMPAGSVSPRNRAIRFRIICACAEDDEADAALRVHVDGQNGAGAQEKGGCRRGAPMNDHYRSPAPVRLSLASRPTQPKA